MKHLIVLIFLIFANFANAANLVVKVVEEGVSGAKDLKFALQSKEQMIWGKAGWTCKAMTFGKEKAWGIFRCNQSGGLEVSSRFNCEKHQSFENSCSFRIANKNEINATFSFWCE